MFQCFEHNVQCGLQSGPSHTAVPTVSLNGHLTHQQGPQLHQVSRASSSLKPTRPWGRRTQTTLLRSAKEPALSIHPELDSVTSAPLTTFWGQNPHPAVRRPQAGGPPGTERAHGPGLLTWEVRLLHSRGSSLLTHILSILKFLSTYRKNMLSTDDQVPQIVICF